MTFENIDNGMGVLFPFWDEGTHMVYIVGKVWNLHIHVIYLSCWYLMIG